ncbi:glycosyltransferase [Escherichia coli]|nr:glycosyltransferase [Escherichia coli]ELB7481234.1 glycosyltransferase [Escherichia coli]EMC0656875.1 glycosyltransferase [Escherichia coli]
MIIDEAEFAESTHPVVSVILPVNKKNPFLDEAINSILSQTFSSFEIIIVANCCTDDFYNELKHKVNDKIKLIRTNIAYLPYSLNKAIDLSNGEFIARMDSDDISHPDRFTKQVDFLKNNPYVDVVGTNAIFIDDKGREINKTKLPEENLDIVKNLPYKCCIVHPSVMFRKKVIASIGGYMFSNYSEDYELWNRLSLAKIKFQNLPEYLFYYRLHEGQSTAKKNLYMVMVNDLVIKMKCFFLTGNINYLFGGIRTIASFIYCKYIK